jgi:hypothetical protein
LRSNFHSDIVHGSTGLQALFTLFTKHAGTIMQRAIDLRPGELLGKMKATRTRMAFIFLPFTFRY